MFCTNCGKKLHDGDRFCGNCGTRVRVEEPKVTQEIVFNPPFKAEAERRTSEIFRGFAESEEKQEPPRRSEPAHFDWNLDGFPVEGAKRTEEVDFNWDSVVERKQGQNQEARSIPAVPVVDKIEIPGTKESMPEPEEGKAQDMPSDAAAAEETETFRWEPLNTRKQRTESTETEPESRAGKEPENGQAKGPENGKENGQEAQNLTAQAMAFILQNGAEKEPETRPKAASEQGADAAELEKEFFGANYRGIAGSDPDGRIKNTAQLEKFYTFNEKKEAFQELLDKEYERLRSMEEERKPDTESLEFTWAGKLFPQDMQNGGAQDMKNGGAQSVQGNGVRSMMENAGGKAASETASEKKEHQERAGAESADGSGASVPADTIDFTPIREEAKLKHQMDCVQEEASGAAGEKTAVEKAIEEPAEISDENPAGIPEAAEAEAGPKPEASGETDPASEAEPETGLAQETAEEAQPAQETIAKANAEEEIKQEASGAPCAAPEKDAAPAGPEESAENAALTGAEGSAGSAAQTGPEETAGSDGITGIAGSAEDSSPSPSPEEKLQLRYSDVFPREGAASDSDGGSADPAGSAAQSGEAEQRKTGQNLTSIFDDEEDDESRGMHPFLKFIVIVLVVLIVLEGIILAAKFIAPDSAFSVKANALVENILDLVTGGGGDAEDKDPEEPVDSDDIQETYLSGILRDRVPQPETIGSVEEDVNLKYDSAGTYAFGEALKAAEPFTDETWTTDEDGRTVTKAQAMMTELVSYYDQWKASNKDTSLIGINKLEIGEILTGEEGYYVLCRLTFAGEDGEDVVKYMTVNMKESQDSMIINEIKEETI